MGGSDEASQRLLEAGPGTRTDGGTFDSTETLFPTDTTQSQVEIGALDTIEPEPEPEPVFQQTTNIATETQIIAQPRQINLAKLVSRFGKLTTFTAMLPQGGFAWLLMDQKLFHHLDPITRLTAGGSIFVTAVAGKYAIVWYFNKFAFNKLVTTKWLSALHSDNWTGKKLFKTTGLASLTIPISSTFGGLAVMGTRGVSTMLQDYDMGFTDFLSDVTANSSVQAIPAGSAVFANFLSFPGIWSMTLGFFDSLIKRVREKKNFQLSQQNFRYDIETVRLYIKALIKKGEIKLALEECEQLLNVLYVETDNDIEKSTNLNNVIQSIIDKSAEDALSQFRPKRPCFLEKKMHLIIPPLLIAATITGLYNFFPLAKTASDSLLSLSDDVLQTNFIQQIIEPTTFLACPPSFLAMAAMSTSVMGAITGKIVVNRIFRREVPLNTLGWGKEITKDLVALGTAILGAFPNLYQALILDDEPIPLASFAIWSSFALELPGLLTLFHSFLNKENFVDLAVHKFFQYAKVIIHLQSRETAKEKRIKQKESYANKVQATKYDEKFAELRDHGYSASEYNHDTLKEDRYRSLNPRKAAKGTAQYMTKPCSWFWKKYKGNNKTQDDRMEEGRLKSGIVPPAAPPVPRSRSESEGSTTGAYFGFGEV